MSFSLLASKSKPQFGFCDQMGKPQNPTEIRNPKRRLEKIQKKMGKRERDTREKLRIRGTEETEENRQSLSAPQTSSAPCDPYPFGGLFICCILDS